MKKLIIGIPMALNYYRDYILWKTFFNALNVDVKVSDVTNRLTVLNGNKYLVDEACLSLKVFMGHVEYLKDKCDYILVPRINCIKKGQKLCTNFTALYDLCSNIFPDVNFLNYNVDEDINITEKKAFIKMGKSLGFKKNEIINAYDKAVIENVKYYDKKKRIFKKNLSSNKFKILVVGHPYNINDNYIAGGIINYLKKEGCMVLLSDIYNKDYNEEDANKLSKKLYWTYNRELFSVINKYKSKVDGIVLVSTFPCGPDSLCNELIIRKIKDIPMISLIIDSLSEDTGLITRLESFLDIIKTRKDNFDNEK